MNDKELKQLMKTADIPLDEQSKVSRHLEDDSDPDDNPKPDKTHIEKYKGPRTNPNDPPVEKRNDNNPDYDTLEDHD